MIVDDVDLAIAIVEIKDIHPSPENDEIYGAVDPDDTDLINLANDISANGIRVPLLVSQDGFIVSGHRRCAAAKLVGLRSVKCIFLEISRSDFDDDGWRRELRAHNHQRVKSDAVRVKETLLDIDPSIAYLQYQADRRESEKRMPPVMKITGRKTRSGIEARSQQFLDAAQRQIDEMKAFWPLSVRQVHYGLLNYRVVRNSSKGSQFSYYENDAASYTALTDLLARARLLGLIPWESIADETRPVSNQRFPKDVSEFLDWELYGFLCGYRRDLLRSQPDHVELIVEKLTVQSIIRPVALNYCLPMTCGRGYCSLAPRYEIVERFKRSGKNRLKLLIAADFDPDGDEIAESLARSIRDDFGIDDVVASKILLRADQVKTLDIKPNSMEAKVSSSRYQKFLSRYGSNHVYELEAISPLVMQEQVENAIRSTIDLAKFEQEVEREKNDSARLVAMKAQLRPLFLDMVGNGGDQ